MMRRVELGLKNRMFGGSVRSGKRGRALDELGRQCASQRSGRSDVPGKREHAHAEGNGQARRVATRRMEGSPSRGRAYLPRSGARGKGAEFEATSGPPQTEKRASQATWQLDRSIQRRKRTARKIPLSVVYAYK